jgi:DNA-directed RNA polymerase subunit omega
LASLAKNEAHPLSKIKIVYLGFQSGGETMKLIDGFDSNYRYILVAARRARQLQSGAPPVVQTNSRKPCRIAQDEIRAGKVKWEIPEIRSAAEQAAEELDKAFGQDA